MIATARCPLSSTHKFKFALSAVLKSGEQTPAVPVEVQARVVRDVEVIPALRHFGDLKIGEVREETIALASRTGRSVDVTSYGSSSMDVSVTPEFPGSNNVFRLKLRSTTAGPQDAEIQFKIHYRDGAATGSKQAVGIAACNVRYYGSR
jgi:hypothetical protein